MYAIGSKTKIKIDRAIRYLKITLFLLLNLIKNITVRGIINNRPSYLTSENKAAVANEIYVILIRSLKNKTKVEIPIKMNNGSVRPDIEFWIILGSSTNKDVPINAYGLSKNFLHNRYIGIIVTTEIAIVAKRCTYIKSRKLSDLITENNTDKVNGHKLLGNE